MMFLRQCMLLAIASLILLLCSAVFAQEQPAEECSRPDQTDLWIGPGIIYSCKKIKFYRAFHRHDDPKNERFPTVTEGDKNFIGTRRWLMSNIYPILNRPRTLVPCKIEFVIMLSTDRKNDMSDVLLTIPLNETTLGPDFKTKILELRRLMTDG